ncbi:FkbM family methyltransferase [Flammeovirga yaeyamensis]|uniref:FkbM family methyltransferase n=1 Tax=Flammeovirga yaeyamensis TaxID=367791 RepID=A0AAX1MYI4_9BACT|nr:FkbM family methyltransferase [Flammeovirga yaeyamensis]MBB3696186.1 hypothetical protein [Flammeovirga yaeyamensis]NMF34869.1 class I SAM-dependent methyltransferase [Flammeovirga yaeyamensis]QWG00304.1 FkbM family methyltransferase [Flammeovirga yaeyamensis]
MATLIDLLQKQSLLKVLLHANYLVKKGFLKQIGWNESIKSFSSIDQNGSYIPWFTYSAIHFLKQRDLSKLNLFEYGSGNSTLWFSDRCQSVHSVEHDKDWYMKIKNNIPSNVKYVFKSLEENYEDTVLESPNLFDIVVIDGRKRVKCAYASLEKLSDNGVIIWDNSDREIYNEGYEMLIKKGFKRLDFYGLAPSCGDHSLTSIFYRKDNCLDI